MAKVTRIKAKDSSAKIPEKRAKNVNNDKKSAQKDAKNPKDAKTANSTKKPMPKAVKIVTWPFRMVAKPFVALGKYIKSSWHELRQVRWPSRAATWKSVLSVLIYTGLFVAIIMLLDALYTLIFNKLLG